MTDWEQLADATEGYAILTRALGVIGSGQTDHDLAKIIVDGETKIRAPMSVAIRALARPGEGT